MKTISDKISLGNLELKNRIIRSTTFEAGAAENGKMTSLLSEVYAELAKGEVGLIITGMMGAGANSCAFLGMVNVGDDSFISSFAQVTSAVHNNGGKIVAQLAHCGVKAGALLESYFFMRLSVLISRGRGYDVAIGKIGEREVDFIAKNAREKIYFQVTEAYP